MAQNDINSEEIVGFENEAEKIIDYLTRGADELDVVPIVGMGGQGKTTIARMVYNKKSIVARFDVKAWCIISQIYDRRELLQEIFSQVSGSKDKGDKEDILADKLRKSLLGKRYLIVLDDMWDCMAWDDLRLSFPDVGNRSRIVVTTRLEKVGEYVKYYTDLYFLPFLTPDESCKLLQKKVFEKEDCPPELQDVSLTVAEKCKGLPLVIVLVAGIIKRKKMEAFWWSEVKVALFDYLGCESEGDALSAMQLSYDNLPDYLKPCLLYMGMFPEDARLPVTKLISLWIAEGFLQNIESGRSMEEAAEGYLMDLTSSNVVMVSRRNYDGKVKECQVHDVVHYFCLEKSREEKFMLAVKGRFQPSHWDESRVSFSFSNDGAFSNWNPLHQCRKLIPKFASRGTKTQKPFPRHLRSLIATNTNAGGFSNWNSFHKVSKMKLLEVLGLSFHEASSLSSTAFQPLIHLKYLEVSTSQFHFHPQFQFHLPYLETLIMKCILSNPTLLPASFWKMKKLRYVHFVGYFFYLEKDELEESSKLENLRILKGIEFQIKVQDDISFVEDVLLRRCPNLQQLHMTFDIEEDLYSLGTYFFKLESLTQLQSLHLEYYDQLGLHLPSNLKKLALIETLKEKAMSSIAGLPNLESLTLKFISEPKELCFGYITFHKLKVLKLVHSDISRLEASEESFPLLETLVLDSCWSLEEIPLSFADISTLKQIKLLWCDNKSLETSAKKIKNDVEENEGCDRIDLIVTNYYYGNIRQL